MYWSRCNKKGSRGVVDLFSELFGMVIAAVLIFWYHTVKRFPSQLSFFHFVLAVAFLFLGLRSGVETVKIVYTAFASLLVLISTVYLMPGENEKSSEDAEVWTNGLTLLMFGTGILTLGMDYTNTKSRLVLLFRMFLDREAIGMGCKKENL